MRHILFEIPLPFGDTKLPLYGFGVLLVVAFLVSGWFLSRFARREGIDPDPVWDVALWVFLGGLVGARITSMILEPVRGNLWVQFLQFFRIWEGGLVIYGAIPGGLIAYLIAHRSIVRPNGLRTLQLADLLAPALALGLAIGRLGCFMNGCCYGDVADPVTVPSWLAVTFPANTPPFKDAVWQGYQDFGFILADELGELDRPAKYRQADARTVIAVDPSSPAAKAGLLAGDFLVKVGNQPVERIWLNLPKDQKRMTSNAYALLMNWPPNEPLKLTVERGGFMNVMIRIGADKKQQPVEQSKKGQPVELTFSLARTVPVQPTQVYSAINAFLLFLLLVAFYPLRRREGAVIALFMITKSASRFLLEALRADNPALLQGLTFSQTISIAMFVAGIALMAWVQSRPVPIPTPKPEASPPVAA